MKRIYTIGDNYGIIPPVFNISNCDFEVVLYKKKLNVPVNVPVNESQRSIVKINI